MKTTFFFSTLFSWLLFSLLPTSQGANFQQEEFHRRTSLRKWKKKKHQKSPCDALRIPTFANTFKASPQSKKSTSHLPYHREMKASGQSKLNRPRKPPILGIKKIEDFQVQSTTTEETIALTLQKGKSKNVKKRTLARAKKPPLKNSPKQIAKAQSFISNKMPKKRHLHRTKNAFLLPSFPKKGKKDPTFIPSTLCYIKEDASESSIPFYKGTSLFQDRLHEELGNAFKKFYFSSPQTQKDNTKMQVQFLRLFIEKKFERFVYNSKGDEKALRFNIPLVNIKKELILILRKQGSADDSKWFTKALIDATHKDLFLMYTDILYTKLKKSPTFYIDRAYIAVPYFYTDCPFVHDFSFFAANLNRLYRLSQMPQDKKTSLQIICKLYPYFYVQNGSIQLSFVIYGKDRKKNTIRFLHAFKTFFDVIRKVYIILDRKTLKKLAYVNAQLKQDSFIFKLMGYTYGANEDHLICLAHPKIKPFLDGLKYEEGHNAYLPQSGYYQGYNGFLA